MAEVTVRIEGMSCQHCVMAVKKAVESVAGVLSAQVEAGKAVVSFDETKAKVTDIEQAVKNAGYKIVAG